MSTTQHDSQPLEDITAWLDSLGLGIYASAFKEQDVTFAELPDLNDDDLKQCGVLTIGHRKRLRRAIDALSPPKPDYSGKRVPGSAAARILSPRREDSAQPASKPDITAAPRERLSISARVPPIADKPVTKLFAARVRSFRVLLRARKMLFLSIAAHLILGVVATYFIVQRSQINKKVTFQSDPVGSQRSERAIEHKVSLAKRSGGAPLPVQRIASIGLAKFTLPEMPKLPPTAISPALTPTVMPGLGALGSSIFGTGGTPASAARGLGGAPLSTMVKFDADFVLLTYHFTDGRDLDTCTKVLNWKSDSADAPLPLGYDMQGGMRQPSTEPFVFWGGDNTGIGFEAVYIDFAAFRRHCPSANEVAVDCSAYWYAAKGHKSVDMQATLFKGGAMTQADYSFENRSATASRMIASTTKRITAKFAPGNEERISVFVYNFKTNTGAFVDKSPPPLE